RHLRSVPSRHGTNVPASVAKIRLTFHTAEIWGAYRPVNSTASVHMPVVTREGDDGCRLWSNAGQPGGSCGIPPISVSHPGGHIREHDTTEPQAPRSRRR